MAIIYPPKADQDGNIILKLVDEYSCFEIQESGFNYEALNAIANGVDINQHELIYMTAKEFWDIVQDTHKEENVVKRSKILLVKEFLRKNWLEKF